MVKESVVATSRPGDEKVEKEVGPKCNNTGDVMSKKGSKVNRSQNSPQLNQISMECLLKTLSLSNLTKR